MTTSTGLLRSATLPGPPAPDDVERSAVVVEDDDDQAELVAATLEQAGFRVTAVVSGEEAVALVAATDPDLVTLDLGLPGIDGLEVCRRLREFTSCYVVVISGERQEDSMLLSLESGADEFLAKPLSPRELRARVAAVCRRPRAWQVSWPARVGGLAHARRTEPVLEGVDGPALDPLVVDLRTRTARHRGREVVLTATELTILTHLTANVGSVCTRADLVRLIAEGSAAPGTRSGASGGGVLNVHVSNLRAKLRLLGAGELVRTVRGVGYRLEPADDLLPSLRLAGA